ncbi:site-specific integrase [Mariprofundus sp. KV]|uniref:site-specific integrase n=1 Tax=Mariprofundus sp. KV TaxID=2608715 RepID=UPI0015A4A026|nr:site-specific integrase [Mariprofundus sp. KV]NWF36666.1 site-specific integrase [Mariprofundus sp. KV]
MSSATVTLQEHKPTHIHESEKDEALAKAQWTILRDIEAEYKDALIPGSSSKFTEDDWRIDPDDTQVGYEKIPWNVYVDREKHWPLLLLCKLVVLRWMKNRDTQLHTLDNMLSQLRPFIEVIKRKNILTGRDGDFLTGLSQITDVDISVVIDAALTESNNLEVATRFCHRLSDFVAFSNFFGEQLSLFSLEQPLPWTVANKTVTKWVEIRSSDLSLVFKEKAGYEALPPETTQPLIERSMAFLDRADKLIEFYNDVRSSRRKGEHRDFLASALRRFEKKYVPKFNDLLPPIHAKVKTRVFISASWWSVLFKLTKAACVNIILLTSGLRNIDVRHLKVGCCKPSGRVDMLYYISTYLKKTGNAIHIPVPEQTFRAIRLLEQLKTDQNSEFILDSCEYWAPSKHGRIAAGTLLNNMLRGFADHFSIPFIRNNTGTETTAHCYRSTVAGWLGASSSLSVLLVRRLFGHSNDVMPTTYLRNNPLFIKQRQKEKEAVAKAMALNMAEAARNGRLGGTKGLQLERGYEQHKSLSFAATDAEIVQEFSEMLEQRILDETVCGFMTPFGVRCMRNPADSSQPPCAKKAHRDKVKDIDKKLLDLMNDINPQMCIGSKCSEAMIGPWSESILKSLKYYESLIRHQQGNAFTQEHFIESARQFIRQYGPDMKKVFDVEVTINV